MPDFRLLSSHLPHYEQQLAGLFAAAPADAAAPPEGPVPGHRSYFICFTNRSGSSLLAQALTHTRRMGRPTEIFNPEPIAKAVAEQGIRSMAHYIDWRIQQGVRAGGVFGAKAGVHQLAWLAAHGQLARAFGEARFVYVTRRDLVMQAVSLHIASSSGVWSSRLGEPPEVPYDAEAITRCLRSLALNQAEFEALFAALGIEPLRLCYEEIEADLGRAMRRVCQHVGIDKPRQVPLPAVTLQRQRTAANEEYARRFRAEFRG